MISSDQAKTNSMKCDHLLAIAQITIESSDIKDEDYIVVVSICLTQTT